MASQFRLKEELSSAIDNPPAGSFKYFHDQTSGSFSCKGSSGNVVSFVTAADIVGLGRLQGTHDASGGLVPVAQNFPTIEAGDFWRVTVAGTIVGIIGEDAFAVGDLIFANVDSATTAGEFFGANANEDFAAVATSGDHSDLNLDDGTNPHGTTAADVGSYTTTQTDTQITNAITAHEAALDPHPQYLTETEHDALPNDNPHLVTFTQSVAADAGTDITAAEAETLTDGSNADTLHGHDHGALSGLGDDDHAQYHNDTRGDARYYQKSEFIDSFTGNPNEPIETASDGNIDHTLVDSAKEGFTVKHPTDSNFDLVFQTNSGASPFGASLSKPGTSGFMHFMPNSATPQLLAGLNDATTAFFVDAEGGPINLNTLPGAGAGSEVVATDGAPLRPDNDLTSDSGRVDKRWGTVHANTYQGDGSNLTGITAAQTGADPAGTAATAISNHVADADPHTQYVDFTTAESISGEKTFTDQINSNVTGAIPNITLNNAAATSAWDIRAGRTAFFDQWLMWKNQNDGDSFTMALTNSGSMRGKDLSAGSPTYGFVDESNMGMYRQGPNELGFSTAGTPRLRLAGDGSARLPGYGSGTITGTEAFGIAVSSNGTLIERKIATTEVQTVNVSAVGFSSTVFIPIPGLSVTANLDATGRIEATFTYSAVRSGGSNSVALFRVVIGASNGTTFTDTLSAFNDTGAVSHSVSGLAAGAYSVTVEADVTNPITINAGQLSSIAVET